MNSSAANEIRQAIRDVEALSADGDMTVLDPPKEYKPNSAPWCRFKAKRYRYWGARARAIGVSTILDVSAARLEWLAEEAERAAGGVFDLPPPLTPVPTPTPQRTARRTP